MKSSLLTPFFISVIAFAPALAAQQPAGLTNFHQLNERVYRGAQPTPQGFQSLAKMGIKTIVDLRESGSRAAAEKKVVEAPGMLYVNIPLNGHAAPTEQQVSKLLALMNDQSAGPVFIHCRHALRQYSAERSCRSDGAAGPFSGILT